MLAEYSDEEIEVVLAHELAHHVHGDIWKGHRVRERADSGRLLSSRRALLRALAPVCRPARRRRRRRPAAAAAGGRRRVGGDAAGRARDVAGVRAERRPLRARPHRQSRRRSSRRCGGWRAESRRRATRRRSSSGCSTATRRFASGSRRRTRLRRSDVKAAACRQADPT